MSKTTLISLSFFTVFIFLSCRNNQHNIVNINTHINKLTTDKLKEQFLINLFEEDQIVRSDSVKTAILKRNNFDTKSAEYLLYSKKQKQIDSINFIKAITYAKKYGYPTIPNLDQRALNALWVVAIHQADYNKRLALFPYIHNAYQNKHISTSTFSFFLNDLYTLKHNKRYPVSKNEEENVTNILKELNLVDL
jgi:hypothetical protein